MKKSLAIVISTLLVLTLFASCKATKAENTLTPDPPTKTTSEQTTILSEEVITAETQSTAKENSASEKNTNKQISSTKNPTAKHDNTTAVPLTVTKEEAKSVALAHAGLSDTDIRHYRIELDRERKILVYEIEFDAGKFEYEYEVNAETGKIIKAEKELND